MIVIKWYLTRPVSICYWLLLALCMHSGIAIADDLTFRITDQNNEPAINTVVWISSPATDGMAAPGTEAVMDQIERQFSPFILPIQAGTRVKFPNWDRIKHHVYSFSKAKRFELKLYSGKNANPVKFDKPGEVALGCNIHDWMLGYIYVVNSPYFALVDSDGRAEFKNIPANTYTVNLWNPGMKPPGSMQPRTIIVEPGKDQLVSLTVNVKQVKQPYAPIDESEY